MDTIKLNISDSQQFYLEYLLWEMQFVQLISSV